MNTDNNSVPRWQVEGSELVADCRIFRVRRDQSRVPHTARVGTFYVLDSPDWVSVTPITPDDQVVLVAQFRHGTGQISLETPGGLAEPGEAPIEAAARELREETGYSARNYRILGQTDANPAFMTNRFTAVLAENVTLTDTTAWDEHEELALHLVPLHEIPALIQNGTIRNTYAVLPLLWYLLERQGALPQKTHDHV